MRDYRYFEVVQRNTLRYRSLVRLDDAVVEPVSIADAKSHLRIDPQFTDDDLYIQGLISSARHYVETVSDRTLIRCRYQMSLDVFPSWDIELPRPPFLPGGSVSVTYVPSDGIYTPVSYTGFRLDSTATPAVIRPPWNGNWPTCRGAENDVVVTWDAGYGEDGTRIPPPARNAMLLMIGSWYANREAVVQGGMNPVPMSVEAMLGTINWGQYR